MPDLDVLEEQPRSDSAASGYDPEARRAPSAPSAAPSADYEMDGSTAGAASPLRPRGFDSTWLNRAAMLAFAVWAMHALVKLFAAYESWTPNHIVTSLLFIGLACYWCFLSLVRGQAQRQDLRAIPACVALIATFGIQPFYTLARRLEPPIFSVPPVICNLPFYLGCLMGTLGTISLGRSFSIIPALRNVKTGGMYAWVRHPMYLGWIMMNTGWVLMHPQPTLLAIYLIHLSLFALRIRYEERLLRTDPAYVEYCQRVPYRLIPGLI